MLAPLLETNLTIQYLLLLMNNYYSVRYVTRWMKTETMVAEYPGVEVSPASNITLLGATNTEEFVK